MSLPTGGPGAPSAQLRLRSTEGRWAVAAAVLGSGVVFIESTVVSVALPAIGRDLGLGVAGLQWIVNGYLVTLGALLLLGGALGDAFGQKRVFEMGLITFAAGSLLCALAADLHALVAARLLQGLAGALLVPTSLAFLDGSFVREDRSEAIGLWAAWSGGSTAVGPLLGGALVDVTSWRWVFAGIVPFAFAALWIARARVAGPAGAAPGTVGSTPGSAGAAPGSAGATPGTERSAAKSAERATERTADRTTERTTGRTRGPAAARGSGPGRAPPPSRPPPPSRAPALPRVDYTGAFLASGGLAALVWALIEGPARGAVPAVLAAGGAGVVLLATFAAFEARHPAPLLPLSMFRSRQFLGANLTTLLVYAAIGAVFFFLMVQLQGVLGYGGLAAGASLLPVNAALLLLSPGAARWGERRGPRVPTALGALVAAAGLALLARVGADSDFLTDVFPGVTLFGIGLGLLVAPLTASVLAVAEEGRTGVASAVNNATARVAGLLAVALLPLAAGIGGLATFEGPTFAAGYRTAMWICAGLCAAGAAVAWLTVKEGGAAIPGPHPSPTHGCARMGSG